MAVRYCPSCDLAGLSPYTEWKPCKLVFGMLMCVGGNGTNDTHATHIYSGRYAFYTYKSHTIHQEAAWPDDDGVNHSSFISQHHDMRDLLIGAMEREAAAGTFEVANWALTFPKRTRELVELRKKAAAAALADKLPVVLVEIVSAYLV